MTPPQRSRELRRPDANQLSILWPGGPGHPQTAPQSPRRSIHPAPPPRETNRSTDLGQPIANSEPTPPEELSRQQPAGLPNAPADDRPTTPAAGSQAHATALLVDPASPTVPVASEAAPVAGSPGATASAPESRSAAALSALLAPHLPQPLLDLTLDLRQRTILTFRRRSGGVELRLHRALAAAPDTVLTAVARFVAGPPRSHERREALTTLRHWFANVQQDQPSRRRRTTTSATTPRDAAHDLEAIRDQLIVRHFAGELRQTPAITWGADRPATACRRSRRRGGGSIRLGSYTAELDLIRIHPRLATADVPAFVVTTVVFHELLHAVIPTRTGGGRRVVHPPEFRRRERAYPDHARAEAWIQQHLQRLLRG